MEKYVKIQKYKIIIMVVAWQKLSGGSVLLW